LGFKGNEDLGGGTSAFFTIEMGLNPQYGNLSGSSAANPKYDLQQTTNTSGNAMDNRQTFVGLKKNGIGQVTIGRQYTVVFNAVAATDAAGMTNMMGDAMYAGGSAAAAGPDYYLQGMTNRADNALQFKTDNFYGFNLNGQYVLNNANSTLNTGTANGTNSQTGQQIGSGNTNWNGFGLGADYSWNKLTATVAYQTFRTKYDNGVAGSVSTYDISGAGPTGGQLAGQTAGNTYVFGPTNNQDTQTFAGASYDFGMLKAYAQYLSRTVSQNTNYGGVIGSLSVMANSAQIAGQTLKRSASQIGVRGYITPTIEAYVQASAGRLTTAITATAATSLMPVNFTMYQLGSNYYLSKRTNLYAIYGQYNASSPVYSSGNAGTGNQYAVGVRHTF